MLRLIERYNSFQGEGPNTGLPTMFVRFAGCNFKCAGWACDTQHAIDPKLFTKTQRLLDPYELAESILAEPVTNICLTGGEPFLQNHDDLITLMRLLNDAGRTIEVFTNGSLAWPIDVFDLVNNFILDWKLPGSGEFPDDGILLENVKQLGPDDAVKFTVKDRADFDRALLNYEELKKLHPEHDVRPVVWCGSVWDCLTTEKLAKWILNAEVLWYLNVQIHKHIWGADTIGV